MYTIIIEHDNGVKGQRGFSDEYAANMEEVGKIISNYLSHGINVYNFSVSNSSERV